MPWNQNRSPGIRTCLGYRNSGRVSGCNSFQYSKLVQMVVADLIAIETYDRDPLTVSGLPVGLLVNVANTYACFAAYQGLEFAEQ